MADIPGGKPQPSSNWMSVLRSGTVAKVVRSLPWARPWLRFWLRFTRPASGPAEAGADDRAAQLLTSESGFPPTGPFIAGEVPDSEKEIAERLLKYVRSRRNAQDGWILFDHLGLASKVNRVFFSLFGLNEEDVRGCSPEEVLATISLACDLQGEFPQISYLSMGVFDKPAQNKNYSCIFKISHPAKRLMQVVRCDLNSIKYSSLLLFSDVSHLPIVGVMQAQSIPGLNDFQRMAPGIRASEVISMNADLAESNKAVSRRRAMGSVAAEGCVP